MTATIVAQQAINGIILGSLYVLVALGLTLIYGVLVQINFAHADFVTLGAFAAYFFMHVLGGGYLASIAIALLVGALLGWAINLSIFAPLRHKGSELLPLIATIGVSTMMQNAMLAWFGPIPYAFETPYSQMVLRVARSLTARSLISSSFPRAIACSMVHEFTFWAGARAVAQDARPQGMGITQISHHAHDRDSSARAGMEGAMMAPCWSHSLAGRP